MYRTYTTLMLLLCTIFAAINVNGRTEQPSKNENASND